MEAVIAVLPGDGIGPEVVEQAVAVLEASARLHGHSLRFEQGVVGGLAIDRYGTALPEGTLQLCRRADAVLFGAVGGPKWDDPSAKVRPEQGLLAIRKGLDLFANLRPVAVSPALVGASTLKPDVLTGVDLVVVRELTGGLYFGERGRRRVDGQEQAYDTMVYSEAEIERISHVAFRLARRRRRQVTSVDKANVLECSRLWRQVVSRVAAGYPDVALEHQLVDSCAMMLVRDPRHFDVILTENTFGDILTDEAAQLTGSIGMLPSASLGVGRQGFYEPIHGSAPGIAGRNVANPLAAILSAAMLLRHSLGLEREAVEVEAAVNAVLERGYRTADLALAGQEVVGTREMGALVVEQLTRAHEAARHV
ncbi:MAG: 3-isopropylmalate dehydrogenase [Anaerolineae bacterium]|nr:3-isopropylmalate dehydrogenase [Anaerolineae bacterium]